MDRVAFSVVVLVLATGLLGAAPALGACHYAGLEFSEGAPVRIGENIYACSQSGIWLSMDEETNANCLYGAGVYSQGAKISSGSVQQLTCQTDGSWE